MDKAGLTELLAEASGRRGKNATFEFIEQDKASLMISTGGAMVSVDEVRRLELKEGFVVVRAGRDDLFLIELERVMGIRLQRSKRDGAGFVAG